MEVEEILNIRYVKLHFTLKFLEDTVLPRNKVSALRGGMGEMLLRANCIRDRRCEKCDFASECIVQRTMYSRMEIQPEFMQKGDSVGYVLECENYEEVFYEEDGLKFQLLLFGKNIVYLNQYLQAFAYLGMEGLGKNKARYKVESVTNTQNKKLVEGDSVYKKNYSIHTISEYARYRMASGQKENKIVFHTPLSVKYQGKMLQEVDMNAIMTAIARRIYILNCFEGIETEKMDITGHVPEVMSQSTYPVSVERYSTTHDEKIRLQGICGNADIDKIDETAHILLYAGELIHIGKNTSFGFGRYSLLRSR